MPLRERFIDEMTSQLNTENLPTVMKNYLSGINFKVINALAERELAALNTPGFRSNNNGPGFIENQYFMLSGIERYQPDRKKDYEGISSHILHDRLTPEQNLILGPLVEQTMLAQRYQKLQTKLNGAEISILENTNLRDIANSTEEQRKELFSNPLVREYFDICSQTTATVNYIGSIMASGAISHAVKTITQEFINDLTANELREANRDKIFTDISVNIGENDKPHEIDIISIIRTPNKELADFLQQVNQSDGAKKAEQFRLAAFIQDHKEAINTAMAKLEGKKSEKQIAVMQTALQALNTLQNSTLTLDPNDPNHRQAIKSKAEEFIVIGDNLSRNLRQEGFSGGLSRTWNNIKKAVGFIFGVKVKGKVRKDDVRPLLQFSTSKKTASIDFGDTFQHLINSDFKKLRTGSLEEVDARMKDMKPARPRR